MDLLGLAPYLCRGRCFILCPQGPLQTPLGNGAVGYGWFPRSMGGPPDVSAILAAREQLWAFLDSALACYPIDPTQLVVLGFSQGGVMAYGLGLQAPQRFAALVALSTWLPPALLEPLPTLEAVQHLPIMMQHGARDAQIQVERARQAVEDLRKWHAPLTYREYDMGHEITGQSLRELTTWLEEKVMAPLR